MGERHDHLSPVKLNRAFVIGFALNMAFVGVGPPLASLQVPCRGAEYMI
jgi:hypothetical protein